MPAFAGLLSFQHANCIRGRDCSLFHISPGMAPGLAGWKVSGVSAGQKWSGMVCCCTELNGGKVHAKLPHSLGLVVTEAHDWGWPIGGSAAACLGCRLLWCYKLHRCDPGQHAVLLAHGVCGMGIEDPARPGFCWGMQSAHTQSAVLVIVS